MPRLARALPVLVLILALAGLGCDDAPRQQGQAPPPDGGLPPVPEDKLPAPWPQVTLVRTPDGGIHPQVVHHKGIHLLYFKGDPRGGDLFYVKGYLIGGGVKYYGPPLRVNSQPGSAIAPPDVCAAQLAVGHDGKAHVAWLGPAKAEPRAPGGATPLLYSRLNDAGKAFETQRNLLRHAVGLDAGVALAAEGMTVWVYWHAPEPGQKGEGNRRIWMVQSEDRGKSFGPKEVAVSPAGTGVSAGCGLRVDPRLSYTPGVLYRAATGGTHRDVYFLHPDHKSGLREPYQATKLDSWETAASPKSTWGLCFTHQGWAAAWETKGQIHYAHLDHQGKVTRRYTAPGEGGKRKHPVVLFGGRDLLLAWTEAGEGDKGDAVAWQVYSGVNTGKDQPAFAGGVITNTRGRANGVPPGGLISAACYDPHFVIFY